jgi:hypothetical protein
MRGTGGLPVSQDPDGASDRYEFGAVEPRCRHARAPIGEVFIERPVVADDGLGRGEMDSGAVLTVDVRREDQSLSRARDMTMRRTWLAPS